VRSVYKFPYIFFRFELSVVAFFVKFAYVSQCCKCAGRQRQNRQIHEHGRRRTLRSENPSSDELFSHFSIFSFSKMDEFRPSSKENLQVSWEGVCIFEKVEVPEFSLGCGRQPFGRCSFQKKGGFFLRELFSFFNPV